MTVVTWVCRSDRQAGLRHLLGGCFAPQPSAPHKVLSDPALQLLFLVPLPVKVPPPRALKVTELSGNSLRLQWEAVAASDVVVYQIKWSTASGEKPQEVRAHPQLWGGWAGSELTCRSGRELCKTIQGKALQQLNSSAGSPLDLAFSGAVTLRAGSRRDSRAESCKLWEDCRSVLENLKDEI